jgi:hypothetical protein
MKVLKLDLKDKNNIDNPTVRIKLELIGGLLFFHTHLTLSVTNPLVKWTHDRTLFFDQLTFRLAGQLSSFLPKELRS